MAFLAGCASGPSAGENAARRNVDTIGAALDVGGVSSPRGQQAASERGQKTRRPQIASANAVPLPAANAPLVDYVTYALYHHPAVRAAYFDWRASVEAIAPARALPDPQFTFQADIANTVMSFMPGLMVDLMGWDKRAAMATEATANSAVAYRTYVATVLQTAANVRKAWIELAYAEDTHRLYTQTIEAADEAVALASAEYRTGQGMVSFEQQLRFQNLLAQHHSHHAAIADRIVAARAKFKSALGLLPTDPDPAWPDATLTPSVVPDEDSLWRRAAAANADIAKMRAMVEMAVASVDVARKAGVPDFTVGAMVDLKAAPRMVRPTANVTLPIWREKIQANIAAAESRRAAAAARVTAEQLNTAAQIAQMLYMIHDSDRMLAYMDRTALPNLERSVESAEAAVQSGMASSTMIPEARLMAIDMRHDRLDALRDRENAVVDLDLMIANVLPEHAPVVNHG